MVVHLLLEHMSLMDKCLMDHQDAEGHMALHMAAQVGSQSLVEELLNWKPNLMVWCGKENDTALHSILSGYNPHGPSQCKQLEKLKCFLEHINGYANAGYSTIQSKARYTILQCVMYHSAHPSWTPFLEYLSGVVDVRIQNVNRDTALHIATKKGLSKELLDILLCGHHGMEAANIPNNKARMALM